MKNFWENLPQPFTVLAPMENVTDFVFREIVSLYLPKPDVLFTEFTNVDALTSAGFDKTIQRFKFSKNQRPVVAQIWGTKPENFFKSAKIARDLDFNGVDINMGCPVKDVVKTGACSALIANPNLAKEIIKATIEGAKNIPTSVKTRIGIKDVVTETWVPFLLEQKISALTIHGRTAKQMSEGEADWNEIKKAVDIRNKMKVNTLIVGNGDVENYDQVTIKASSYKVDGVMIGRGIFKNPWIFEKTEQEHSVNERFDVLIKHIKLFDKEYPGKKIDVLKKFFKIYVKNFDGAVELRNELMQLKIVDEILKTLKGYKV